jgi:hypothetical protein
MEMTGIVTTIGGIGKGAGRMGDVATGGVAGDTIDVMIGATIEVTTDATIEVTTDATIEVTTDATIEVTTDATIEVTTDATSATRAVMCGIAAIATISVTVTSGSSFTGCTRGG